MRRVISERKRRPEWIRSRLPGGKNYINIKSLLRNKNLNTVCEEAKCPNLSECWAQKTATIMILGDVCTRYCKFCNVKTGNPKGVISNDEILNSVEAINKLNLEYVVVTSVDRDDLSDGGASHFVKFVNQCKVYNKETKIELLIPDFDGRDALLDLIGHSNPFVIAHNVETVKSLTFEIRDRRSSYEQSLYVLEYINKNYPEIATKSSIMLGLGEKKFEIIETMKDLKQVGVNILTLGQYLAPSLKHKEVVRYYAPWEFDFLKMIAYEMGFSFVASGPFVRSSYKAKEYFSFINKNECN